MDFYLLFYEHLFVFRKPENDEDISQYKDSIKWVNSQLSSNEFQPAQANKPSQATATNIEVFETKLNPYGFIYIPKNALPKLPFRTRDKLSLRIDNANGCVIITSTNKNS